MVDPDSLRSNESRFEDLIVRTVEALRWCSLTATPDGTRIIRVESLLQSVATNVASASIGFRMAARLNVDQGARLRQELSDATWDTVEHAAMSLAVEDVITAMDLCAAVIQSLVGEPTQSGSHVWDVSIARRAKIPEVWAPLRDWLDNLVTHQHYERLITWRHALAHRGYERTTWSVRTRDAEGVEGLDREPTTIYVVTKGGGGPPITFALPADLATCVLLGIREFRAFLAAGSQVAVSHPVRAS
jgi:hypothetical protein